MSDSFYTDHQIEMGPPLPIELVSSQESNPDELALSPTQSTSPPAAPASANGKANRAPSLPRHSLDEAPRKGVSGRAFLSNMPQWLNNPAVMPQQWQVNHDPGAGRVPRLQDLTMPARGAAAMRDVGSSSQAARTAPTACNSARTALPGKETSTSESSESRMVWNTARNELLVDQVLAARCVDAPHGHIRAAWEGVAARLSTMTPFENFGGIKGEACRNHYMELTTQFRKDNTSSVFKSGARTWDSEELHCAPAGLMADEDGIGATAAAKLGRENEQARRAEPVVTKSMKTSGSSSCKKHHGDDGATSTPSGSKDSAASGSAYSPISITSDIGGCLRSNTNSEDLKRRKVAIDMLRAQTEAKVAENKAMEIKALLQVANNFAQLLEKYLGDKQAD